MDEEKKEIKSECNDFVENDSSMDNDDVVDAQNEDNDKGKKKSLQREILEWILVLVVAFVVAKLINNYVFRIAMVSGESMVPTLQDRERLLLWELGYTPENGDIIVLQLPGKEPYVKRVIATEGQTVEINYETNEVYVDGKVLKETYIAEQDMISIYGEDAVYPITVDKDCVFVLGDNRNHSSDSRSVGLVHEDYIMGKAVFRIWPVNSIGTLD